MSGNDGCALGHNHQKMVTGKPQQKCGLMVDVVLVNFISRMCH